MNKLLIDDYPIQVLPKLAEEIGLNEAIFLQQLHYWLNGKSAKHIDGKKWIYNTFENWQEQFPFWSVSTVKRTINALSQRNLILRGNYNRAGFDKTVWYSINYEEVNRVNQRLGQNDLTRGSNCTNGEGQNDLTNTIDYTKTTSESNEGTTLTVKNKHRKTKHGEFDNVLLTDDELMKLKERFPNDLQQRIERLSDYVASTGKAYKSHYATIISWAKKDTVQQPKKQVNSDWEKQMQELME
jgi:hypothetical protein